MDRKLSDKEMASRLGCSRQLYQKTRTGQVPVRHKIMTGIMAVFPELQDDLVIFLSKSANKLSNKDNQNDTH